MPEPEKITDYLELARKEVEPQLDKPIGLIFIFIFLVFFQWFCLNKVGQELLNSYFLLFWTTIIDIPFSFLIWLKNRHIKKFMSDEVGILIAISKIDSDLTQEIDRLHKKLDSLIQQENLNFRTKIVVLPERLIPRDEKEAHRIRDKQKAQLIIWGVVESGNQNQEKIIKFPRVSFSYRLALPVDKAQQINNSVMRSMSQRQWYILEKDNIIHREYLARNLEEISLYILGVIFFFQKQDKVSFRLLKSVREKYALKINKTIEDRCVEADIKAVGHKILMNMGRILEFWPNSKNIVGSVAIAEEIIRQCKEFGTEDFSLLFEAQMAFGNKNLPRAFLLIERARTLFPNTPSPTISLAFLYFYQGILDKGWINLKKGVSDLKKTGADESEAPNIARFYEETIKESPGKMYIHFPLGYIYLNCFRDLKLAKESFEKFVEYHKDHNEKIIKSMLFQSNKFLRKIERL